MQELFKGSNSDAIDLFKGFCGGGGERKKNVVIYILDNG